MAAAADPSRPYSADLHVIRRLNSSLYWAAGEDRLESAHANSPFARSHPSAVSLAPLRHDIPLVDPCCGQLSAGAQVDLGIKGRRKFIDFRHVASALWVPPGCRERPQSAVNTSSFSENKHEDRSWNSSRILDAPFRARLTGKETEYVQMCSK